MAQPDSIPLTIYKIKSGRDANAAFDQSAFQTQKFHLSGASNCLLAARQNDPVSPSWLPFVEATTGTTMSILQIAQAGALLYLEVKKEPIVVSFGSAHMKLREEAIDRGFGLRVALNCIQPEHMSTVDSQNLDLNGIQRRIQASTTTSLEEFDLDIEGSLVRAVTGKPTDTTVGTKITGRDGLRLLTRCGPKDLPALITRLLEFADSDEYRKNFDWVDNLEHVRDPVERESLDVWLVEALGKGAIQHIWLALPEILDWVEVEGFVYGPRSREVESDLSLSKFLDRLGSTSVSIDLLRNSKVRVVGSSTGAAIRNWSIYKCMYAEATSGPNRYVLSGGEWYRVRKEYHEELQQFMKVMKCSVDTLPNCPAGAMEDAYNAFVCKNSDEYLLGDKKVWSCETRAGRLELCDFYSTKKRRIIHVKKYGQSKVLGHLFNQAFVSSEVLVLDKKARKKANKLLGGTGKHFPDDFNPAAYSVVMAIISEEPGDGLSLPLFSRITFRASVQRIRALGYKPELAKIRQPHFSKGKSRC